MYNQHELIRTPNTVQKFKEYISKNLKYIQGNPETAWNACEEKIRNGASDFLDYHERTKRKDGAVDKKD